MKKADDAVILTAFREYLRKINIFRLRIGCVLGFTLVPLFSLLDYFTVPHHFRTLLLIRLACALITLSLFLFSFTSLGRKNINFVGGAAAILIGGTIALMVRYTGGYESPYYAGLNLVMLAITLLFTWDVKITAGICLVIYGFYIVPILFYDPIQRPELFINNNAFLLTTVTIALISAFFVSRLRYQEFESLYRLEESQKALQVSNKKLEELGEMRGRFFADISHELRTPLSVIRGEAEVTLRGKDKSIDEYKRVLQYIILLTEQLNKLVSDLLFLARSESGVIQIEKKAVKLHETLSEVYREGEILALSKKIKISLQALRNTDIVIHGDPERLKQLFLIIVDNAIKYSNLGGEVTLSLEREGSLGRVVISDRGVGIPEEVLPHVFERFYRVEESRSMAQGGAGLGLAIAKWIAEAHQGTISISSAVGKGTIVTTSLPISEAILV